MIVCGHCEGRHHHVDTVRRCARGEVHPCDWLVQRGYNEDGEPIILDCGAAAWADDWGWHCEAGHEHASLETQDREGWSYASDEEEAQHLARYGVETRLPDGKFPIL